MIRKRGNGREEDSLGEETAAESPPSHSFLSHMADSFYTLTAGNVIK
jgi:hypothetical protein